MMKRNNSGFTLVELAIVLVIIGLLVGGVLQGQELIKQAQIRNAIGRINEFDTAINTFRAKYRYLPGDIPKSSAFGLDRPKGAAATAANYNVSDTGLTDEVGNGNGLLEDVATAGSLAYDAYSGEIGNFWAHLSNAQLVKGNYNCGTGNVGADCGTDSDGTEATTGTHFPDTAIGNGLVAVTDAGRINYVIGLPTTLTTAAAMTTTAATDGTSMVARTLTPEEAYGIDSKIDDGLPVSGGTQTIIQYEGEGTDTSTDGSAFEAETAGAATCNTAADYNLALDSQLCTIRVRASG